MINHFRTLLPELIVRYLSGPRALLQAAWGWLAGEGDLDHKQRCLEAILELDPGNERAVMALLWVKQQQRAVDDLHPATTSSLPRRRRLCPPARDGEWIRNITGMWAGATG